jgi:hypothetical protein
MGVRIPKKSKNREALFVLIRVNPWLLLKLSGKHHRRPEVGTPVVYERVEI